MTLIPRFPRTTMRPTAAPLLALGLALTACAPPAPRTMPGAMVTPSATPERIVAPSVPTLDGMPAAVRVGFTVHVSGMVPVDSAGRVVGTDLNGQFRQALGNLVTVVRAARGVPGDVVRLTVYLRDPSTEAVETVRSAVLDILGKEAPPALTVVGMSALPEASMRVMVDGTAQLRSEFPDRTRRP
ncbi:MAG: RidA family protein [Gemmatimonadales bacterium]